MNFSNIYKLVPHMQVYNELGYNWEPFIMSLQKPNFRSKVVNTDNFGLRFNGLKINDNESIFNEHNKESKKKIGAILGSSASFGVGASTDNFTISSIVSEKTENHFYNLAGRAYSGFQEIVLFNSLINKLDNLETLIVFSGVNDIFFNSYIEKYDQILGPIFFNKQFKEAMVTSSLDWKKKMIKYLFQPFLSNDVDWYILNKKDLLNNLFKKNNIKYSNRNNTELIKTIIKRNLRCLSNIQKGMKVKLIYFLQPLSIWCKRQLSNEENMIFEELDKISFKTNSTLKSLNFDIYNDYNNYLATTCKELDIEFFDCNKYFSSEKFDKKWIFLDRIHMTDLGNKYIGELIASKLK